MRQTTIILAAIMLASGFAAADTLTISGIGRSVRVVDVAKGKISYEWNGRDYDKLLGEVNYIALSGHRNFTKAEDALKAGKLADAVAAYNACEAAAGKPAWVGRLIRYRRLKAAAGAKMSGLAVADWLGIVDETDGSSVAVMMAPEGVAAKGSSENAKAIQLLEKRVGGKDNAVLAAKVKEMLLALYAVEGLSDKAAILNASTAPTTTTPGNGRPTPPKPTASDVSIGKVSNQLQEVASQIKLGQYDAAVENIQSRINRFRARELPGALLLQGKALRLSYDKGGAKDRKKLLAAGLCFMRIVACFDASTPEASEALYLAAMVERAVGNRVAGDNALRLLISRYRTSDWAKKAQAALGGQAGPE